MTGGTSEEELQRQLDDGILQISREDPDRLVFRIEGGFLAEFSLRDVVYAVVGKAETIEDADDLLDLSRHLSALSKEVRQAASGLAGG
jgi:hypothetical protein